jgi:hypothetical protein
MEVDKLISIVTLLITLSVASERLVEIIKGYFPSLNADVVDDSNANPVIADPDASPAVTVSDADIKEALNREAKRKAKVSLLAVGCGIVTAWIASPILAGIFKDLFSNSGCQIFGGFLEDSGKWLPCGFNLSVNGFLLTTALGLLASGGSSLWNSILEYLLKIKDLKKVEVRRAKEDVRRERALNDIDIEAARRRLLNEGITPDSK